MTTVRSLPTALLRFVGILLYRFGLARLVIRLRGNTPRVVAYHACEPSESAFTRGLACNTPPALLAQHIAFFATHYEVVPLATIVDGTPERALAVTFDDAYRSVYQHALPILRQHRYSAAVFVVTDALDENMLIWVNELAWLLNTGGDAARRAAAGILSVRPDSPIDVFVARARDRCVGNDCRALLDEVAAAAGIEPPPDSHLYMSWTEVAAATEAGLSFGNHTATHPDLGQLDAVAQREEMVKARLALETHLPAAVVLSALAYPFGAYNRHSREAAASAGIRLLLGIGGTTEYGDPMLLPRTPVGEVSVSHLFADLEIVEPAKAAFRRLLSRLARRPLIGRGDWHVASPGRRVPGAPQV